MVSPASLRTSYSSTGSLVSPVDDGNLGFGLGYFFTSDAGRDANDGLADHVSAWFLIEGEGVVLALSLMFVLVLVESGRKHSQNGKSLIFDRRIGKAVKPRVLSTYSTTLASQSAVVGEIRTSSIREVRSTRTSSPLRL